MSSPAHTEPAAVGPSDHSRSPRPAAGSARLSLVVPIVCATATSAVAFSDAMVQGVTGHSMLPADTAPVTLAVDAVNGITYAALCWVLVSQARRIDGGSRVRRWLRRLLIGDLAILSTLFLVGIPLLVLGAGSRTGPLSVIGNITFLAMFTLAFALGVATIRNPDLRPAPYLLIGIVPAIGLIIALGALGSDFAHPAYAVTLVTFGIALFALPHRRAVRSVPSYRAEPTGQ